MERKLLIFKTHYHTEVGDEVITELCSQLSAIAKQCCKSSVEPFNPLTTTGLSYCVLPQTCWTKVQEDTDDLSQVIKTAPSSSSSEEDVASLSSSIHTLLDLVGPPGTFLLTILWLCDTPPSSFPPVLYGCLQRAVSWHSANISVITTTTTCTDTPPWLLQLRAEVFPVSYLCTCHGLQEFISPQLVWRGNLAFYQEPDLTPLTLPGFELHLDTDILTQTMSTLELQEGVVSSTTSNRLFSSDLEVVSSVPLSSVLSRPHILTSQKLLLKTSILEEDDFSNQFMTTAFQEPDMAMVLKLKFSVNKPKADLSLMKTENWKNSVINCNFSPTPPCPSMGDDVSAINILIFDDPETEGDCSRSTHQKAAVLLKNIQELGQMNSLRQVLSKQEVKMDTVKELVQGKIFHVDDSKHSQLKQFVRSVQAQVLGMLHDTKSDFLQNNDVEDILIAVQEKIMTNIGISMYTTVSDKSFEDLEESTALRREQLCRNIANPEDWQEKRFLRFLKLHSENEDKILQSKSILKPNEEDYVLLEAKELLKFFDKEGLPTKSLEPAEAKNKNCPLRPQKSDSEYQTLMRDNFYETESNAHSYKGFKFKGEDFSKVEFTQFHDVYYNTGISAEAYDLECKNLRDCMVGPSRETESTFTVWQDTTRIKLGGRKTETQSKDPIVKKQQQPLRTSPRKKVHQAAPVKKLVGSKLSPRSKKPESKQHPAIMKAGKDIHAGGNLKNVKAVGSTVTTKKAITTAATVKADNTEKRKSGGGDTGDLSEVNRKKLRGAVYEALLRKDVREKDELFRPCFSKLFNICKMYVMEAQTE